MVVRNGKLGIQNPSLFPTPGFNNQSAIAVLQRLTFQFALRHVPPRTPMPNPAVERDGLQAALAGSLRASRSGRPSPLR
jgi:hypothetical protein